MSADGTPSGPSVASSACLTFRKIHTTSDAASIIAAPTRNAAVAPSVNVAWKPAASMNVSDVPGRGVRVDAGRLRGLRQPRPDLGTLLFTKCSETVLSVARPSAPPTCCMVFSTPEPMPESAARTWWTAVRVSGTNVMPMPIDMVITHGKIDVQ